jgi:hypothetical protein
MARIRSLKPEAFTSESLSKVSVSAERTFYGMSTIADDRGRLVDKPAQINGDLWSMRGGHTPADLENELQELVKADELVCRYTGCNGKRYLHLVTWDWHQKIDKPGKTRVPRCPHHPISVTGVAEVCGLHQGDCEFQEGLFSLDEVSGDDGDMSRDSREISPDSRDIPMVDLVPRTVDRGSRTVPPTAGAKPRRPRRAASNAADVVAAYMEGAASADLPVPSGDLRGRVGRQANRLLKEYPLDALILAARHMGAVGWNDLSVQLQRDGVTANGQAPPANSRASPGGHRPFRNPDDQSAYDEEMRPA